MNLQTNDFRTRVTLYPNIKIYVNELDRDKL